MILCTTDEIPGKKIVATYGLVRGNAIRARHVGKDIMAGLQTLVGGEIHEYTKLMGEVREQSLDRMSSEAKRMGANAVVGLRMSTSMIMNNAAEMVAYGTAVKVEEA
ncbi:YbjQ family protein [Pelagicoccus sp. SDUM812003]|uniref:YbjQ family protein n=1 Tax=Pelagicoccus sp. SDUM812003 TaxID=3041267 RepID=UPI00280CCCF7|nr:YbjQ family protein [Pelagicoccus sp. SDUM812003]MDQ8203006.1 YbjQ family protein [Pelagicoccus sp. SDUM812003]